MVLGKISDWLYDASWVLAFKFRALSTQTNTLDETSATANQMTNAEILSRMNHGKPRAQKFDVCWPAVGAGFPPVAEYRGIPGRDFRFDYAWPSIRVALEIDGGVWMRRGGHTTGTGKTRDCEKDWLAAQFGWRVIRWTSEMVGVKNCERLIVILKSIK